MTETIKTPGQILKAAREANALSIADIAGQMRLSKKAIEDIENDLYEHLGVRTFVRGYLVTYGRIVGSNNEELLALFETICPVSDAAQQHSVVEGAPVMDVTRERSTLRPVQKLWIASAGLLLLIFMLIFHESKKTSPDMTAVASQTQNAAVTTASTINISADTQTVPAPQPIVAVSKKSLTKPSVVGAGNIDSNTPFVHQNGAGKMVSVAVKPAAVHTAVVSKTSQPGAFTVTSVTPGTT